MKTLRLHFSVTIDRGIVLKYVLESYCDMLQLISQSLFHKIHYKKTYLRKPSNGMDKLAIPQRRVKLCDI